MNTSDLFHLNSILKTSPFFRLKGSAVLVGAELFKAENFCNRKDSDILAYAIQFRIV